jgi:hypothetical protein
MAGDTELADRLFDQKNPKFNPKAKIYDLHGYNFAETYLICRKIFTPNRVVDLIVGKGSHSVGKSVVRQAVKFFCKRHNISLEVSARNEGLFRATAPADFTLKEMRFAYASQAKGYYELDYEMGTPARGGAGGNYSVAAVFAARASHKATVDEGYYFA